MSLIAQEYDIHYGARSLQHAVDQLVINRLAAAHEQVRPNVSALRPRREGQEEHRERSRESERSREREEERSGGRERRDREHVCVFVYTQTCSHSLSLLVCNGRRRSAKGATCT